ncbi:MAG: hypothetical protein Udaeo2_30540 [Candidatus Udaeobacter sp.]|nr:MAG: hypothetical protein Udaeo2_30540 [Candidatus Udaeobacter sp.]
MPQPHSASAEEESLKLVEDFNDELRHAIHSVGDKNPTPDTMLSRYRFWSAKHLQRAVDGFAFLRRSGRVDGSKFLVRPAIEMAFRLQAARQDPDLFYRIAHEERRQDKHLMQGQPKLQAQSDENWERFKNAFVTEFPTVPIPDLCERCDRLTIERVAQKARMKPYYDSHYRIYSRYTHGALQASTGNIDKATDRADNQIIAVCALVALDNLISLGAKSPNHDSLEARIPRFSE